MLEETSQTNAIVRKMRLLANNNDVVFSPLNIVFHELFAFVPSAPSSNIPPLNAKLT